MPRKIQHRPYQKTLSALMRHGLLQRWSAHVEACPDPGVTLGTSSSFPLLTLVPKLFRKHQD